MMLKSYFLFPGATRSKEGMEVFYARQKVVTTAKAYRLQVIDMVDINFKGKSYTSL